MLTAGAVGLAFLLEAVVVEPPESVHPVAWFGRLVGRFDREWSHPRLVGAAATLVLPAGFAAVAAGVVTATSSVHPVAGAAAVGLVLFVSTSLRMLLSTAREVTALTGVDIGTARSRLRALAGRPAASLTGGQLRSAAVESAAENLADGLVAPLLAFAVLVPVSPALGAAGAAWVKAVNTMDSMLGYRSKPVGYAPARLDDAVMWVPARASAVLLALVARDPGALGRARRWLDGVPSPNAGWPMGTLAAVLGVRLEKLDTYVLNPDADYPTPEAAERGVALVAVAGVVAYLLAGAAALVADAGVVTADGGVPWL